MQTGVKPSASKWSVRWTRLVPKLITVSDEDLQLLGEVKTAVEAEMEEQKKAIDKKKWGFIAEALKQAGGDTYPPNTLETAWKNSGQ